MSDLISRQAAIDALVAETIYTKEELREYHEANSHRNEWVNGIYEAVEVIEQLPSAEPQIIRCKYCKHYDENFHRCNERYFSEDKKWMLPNDFCSYAERRSDE